MEREVEHAMVRELCRIADAVEVIAEALVNEPPEWARRMEDRMADLAQAIADLQGVDQGVVDELKKLADEVRNAPDVNAAADQIEQEATKLQQAISDAETPAAPPPPPQTPGT